MRPEAVALLDMPFGMENASTGTLPKPGQRLWLFYRSRNIRETVPYHTESTGGIRGAWRAFGGAASLHMPGGENAHGGGTPTPTSGTPALAESALLAGRRRPARVPVVRRTKEFVAPVL